MLVFENLTIKDLKNHYFIEDFSYSLGKTCYYWRRGQRQKFVVEMYNQSQSGRRIYGRERKNYV